MRVGFPAVVRNTDYGFRGRGAECFQGGSRLAVGTILPFQTVPRRNQAPVRPDPTIAIKKGTIPEEESNPLRHQHLSFYDYSSRC